MEIQTKVPPGAPGWAQAPEQTDNSSRPEDGEQSSVVQDATVTYSVIGEVLP